MRPVLFFLAASLGFAADKPFTPLFDGKTLNGWELCNGKASYRAEGGTIVGTTVEGSPNSFLCTTREYGDFVLEYETKTDPKLNSGLQVRSHRYLKETAVRTLNDTKYLDRKQPAGRVYGYQVEVSTEEAGNSGGIYDEGRRGWVDNLKARPEAARKAFKDNQWNRYRVVASGDSIKTWLNGVPCADLIDPLDQTGFIALQVHAVKGEKPLEVRWRNLRIKDLGKHEWKSLWDGKTLNGWSKRGGGSWTVEDGAIHAVSLPNDERVGYIMSDQSIKDATVRVLFKIVKGNSGFFVRTSPDNMAAYEVEIDEAKGTGGFWETGPNGRKWVTGPSDNEAVKQGEWNELVASVHGHRIVFHLNGTKTLDLPDDKQGRLDGRLALQVHGAKRPTEIWFKDVSILQPAK